MLNWTILRWILFFDLWIWMIISIATQLITTGRIDSNVTREFAERRSNQVSMFLLVTAWNIDNIEHQSFSDLAAVVVGRFISIFVREFIIQFGHLIYGD